MISEMAHNKTPAISLLNKVRELYRGILLRKLTNTKAYLPAALVNEGIQHVSTTILAFCDKFKSPKLPFKLKRILQALLTVEPDNGY